MPNIGQIVTTVPVQRNDDQATTTRPVAKNAAGRLSRSPSGFQNFLRNS